MMITVIEQSTSKRNEEIASLFNEIKPFLDQGYTYKEALRRIGKITVKSGLSRKKGWFRDLTDYGASKGYVYGDYIYSHTDKVGKPKVMAWDWMV